MPRGNQGKGVRPVDLMRWNPGGDFSRLRDEVNRLFDWPRGITGREGGLWQPSIDVYETENDVVVKAEVPGVAPDDLDVRVTEASGLMTPGPISATVSWKSGHPRRTSTGGEAESYRCRKVTDRRQAGRYRPVWERASAHRLGSMARRPRITT